ncbi:uncharacterized protein LOC119189632 [Manduca sexta]|uniref:uncharacterized protein LOC119189632 n=1 Tax=Manduca sexta TaxID=7130 RepID=UPI0018906802|nr:uncharacterized protein LOC119189632 [Manduca sexta]
MNENEEFDDLPPIEVDCLSPKTSNSLKSESFVMPAADELASQRERELLCEQELRALSASHVARCDSSGSEGEAALAAAVQALSVLAAPTPPAATPDALSTRSVLSALLPHLPPAAFLNKYLHATDYLDDATLTAP